MRRVVLVAALAGCSAEAPTLQVPVAQLRPGLVCDTEEHSRSSITIGGKAMDEEEHLVSQVRVLEASGTVATHVEVTYQTHTIDGGGGPLQGQTYDVRVGDRGPLVRRKDGGEPSERERERVVDDHRELGKPPALGGMLASRPWTRYRTVALDDAELAEIARARADEGMTPEAGSFTWTGRRGDTAYFVSGLRVLRTAGSSKITARMTGAIEVDVRTGVIGSVASQGTMTGSLGPGGEDPVHGTLETRSLRRCR